MLNYEGRTPCHPIQLARRLFSYGHTFRHKSCVISLQTFYELMASKSLRESCLRFGPAACRG